MTYFEEALEMARASGDVWAAASALSFSGSVALTLGDPGRARPLLEESTRLSVESGDREVFVHATAMLAEALTALGAADEARAQLVTGRDAALETTNPLGVVLLLDAAAGLARRGLGGAGRRGGVGRHRTLPHRPPLAGPLRGGTAPAALPGLRPGRRSAPCASRCSGLTANRETWPIRSTARWRRSRTSICRR